MELLSEKKAILRCRAGSCCPTVEEVSPDEFVIRDDYNGKVTLTREHLSHLKDAIEYFNKAI